jgi:hypothetical protein
MFERNVSAPRRAFKVRQTSSRALASPPIVRLSVFALAGIALACLSPLAQAHGLVNAGELETLFIQDEASDIMTEGKLGYDLLQIYVGEAFVPGTGDGLYLHTVLYGGAGDRPGVDGPQSVRFTFTTDKGTFMRTLNTTDGATFTSDFDSLVIVPGSGEVEVQRAFVRYPAGIGPGAVLKSLKAESFVGGDLRDVAPGGMYLHGVPIGEPGANSKQVVDSYTLRGPIGYLAVAQLSAGQGNFTFVAHNPLKKGDEHIMLLAPDANGWHAEIQGSGEVKAGGNVTFHVQLVPGSGPFHLDLVTDIGGHMPLDAQVTPQGLTLKGADQSATVSSATHKSTPNGALLVPLALALALARRSHR